MFKAIVRASVAAIVLAVVAGVALQQFGLLASLPQSMCAAASY
jgi:hypothetical protein